MVPAQPPRTLLARLQWPMAALLLSLCVVLGGGQGTPGDAACQILALLLIALVLSRNAFDPAARLPAAAWLAALPLALPALQLLPVPEALWLAAPARAELATQLATAGADAPQQLSLVPYATQSALAWLLPAVALFLSMLQFNARERIGLAGLMVAMALLGMVLGTAQLFAGAGSPLRFYDNTNPTSAVGFFANVNHLGSQLAVALPFVLIGTAAWWSARRHDGGRGVLWLVVGIGVAIALMLGLALAKSRAGLLLGMLGIALSLPALIGLRRKRGTRRALAIAVVVGLGLGVQFALFGILQRFQQDPLQDARFHYTQLTLQAAAQHAPLGTGLGGFRRAFEAVDVQSPITAYINHAHNDYAELWLDGGWLAVALALPLAFAFLVGSWRAWRRMHEPVRQVMLARAASIGLLLLGLHSLGDYPLRTTALLATAGLMAGMLAASRNPPAARTDHPAQG